MLWMGKMKCERDRETESNKDIWLASTYSHQMHSTLKSWT